MKTYTHNGQIRQLIDRMVATDSPSMRRAFESRRNAAEKRQDERVAQGVESKLEVRETRRIGRNDPCPCGSNVKFKKCCGRHLSEDDTRVAE